MTPTLQPASSESAEEGQSEHSPLRLHGLRTIFAQYLGNVGYNGNCNCELVQSVGDSPGNLSYMVFFLTLVSHLIPKSGSRSTAAVQTPLDNRFLKCFPPISFEYCTLTQIHPYWWSLPMKEDIHLQICTNFIFFAWIAGYQPVAGTSPLFNFHRFLDYSIILLS